MTAGAEVAAAAWALAPLRARTPTALFDWILDTPALPADVGGLETGVDAPPLVEGSTGAATGTTASAAATWKTATKRPKKTSEANQKRIRSESERIIPGVSAETMDFF